jgi:hypothetical protein
MDKWRVGDDTGSKETDGCPLTTPFSFYFYSLFSSATYLLVVLVVTVTIMVTVT